MSFSKGVAPMSVHSLLDPSNSESFPEVDLVSTVRMAWLPPQVKYWISNLHRKIKKKKKKTKNERIILKNIPLWLLFLFLLLLLLFFLPSLRVVISEQLAVRIEQDAVMAVAKGDPDREIRGLQAGARLSACRLAVTLVHQEAHLAPCQHSPLRHSLATKKIRIEIEEEEKRRRLTYVFSSPTCNTPLWRWGEARPVNENTTTLMDPSSGQPPSIEPLGFSRSIFTLGKKLLIVIIREIEDERMRFVYLDRPLESTALYSSNTAPGLPSSWNCWIETCIFEIFVVQRRLNLPNTGIAWWISPSRPKIRIRTNGAGENSIMYNILGTISE